MKRNIKKIILFIIVFFNLLMKYNAVFADRIESYNDSTIQKDKINFKNLIVNDGLSSNLITDIYQDSTGYIWIGTEDGLNKYNGNVVVKYSYKNDNENSITSPHITSINEDRYKNIWVGTDYGLNIINREGDKIIRIGAEEGNDSELSNWEITEIYRDSNDTMWVATKDGLNKYDEVNNKFIKYYSDGSKTSITNNHITDIQEDDNGYLWVATIAGISIIDLNTNSIYNNKSEVDNLEYVYQVEKNNKGEIWILSKGGIFKVIDIDYEKETYKADIIIEKETDNNITKMLYDNSGNMWLSEGDGLIRYILNSKETQRYKAAPDYLLSNTITCLYEDRSGVIWVGTNKGINILNIKQQFSNKINNILNTYGIYESSITTFLEDNNNDLWIGTDGNGLIKFNLTKKEVVRFVYNENDSNSLLSNKIKYILESINNKIIIFTEKGVNTIDKESYEIHSYSYYKININLFFNENFKIINDDKYLWIATMDGLYRDSHEKREVVKYKDNFLDNGIKNYKIYDIFQDESDENILWLAGGLEGGLIKFHKTEGIIKNYLSSSEENSLSYDSINCIQGDGKGNLWIGTEYGLNKFNIKDESFTNYYEQDGLANNYINSIIVDDGDNIWIGTSNGLSKFIVNENRFVNFTEVDGVCGNQFNKRAAYKTNDGELLFGTTKGVVSFNPDNIEEVSAKVDKVVIDTLWINRKLVVNDRETIKLKYNENNISILYFLPDYTRIDGITYLYKMDGVNNQWNVASSEGYSTYTMLQPGDYIFRVKAVNSDGSFTEETTLKFNIKRPFWKSNTAYCIYISLVLIIIIFILAEVKFMKKLLARQRKEINHQLEENKKLYERNIRNEKFKNDYFVNLSHELRTPLNIILSVLQLLNYLEENDGFTKEKFSHYMDVIKKSSNSLLSIINDIIDSSKIESGAYKISKQENIDIVYLVEETALNMSDYINNKGIELIIDPEIEELLICCDSKEIERCVVNLIGNAVKFTEKDGNIKVLIKEQDNTVSISIEDNGLGISKDDQEFIFKRFEQGGNVNSTKVSSSGIGLTLVKYIVELHGGHVELESELGKGSKFTLVLPIN